MIGILYICTGKYHIFWKEFFLSAEKFLLPDQDLTYFVFTDAEVIYEEGNPKVKKIFQKSLGWPYNTLFRFEIFYKAAELLKQCDYLFFLNSNIVFVDEVGHEILPAAENEGLMGVIHPLFWDKPVDATAYERNPGSTAYISYGAGKHYFMGAFNGGQTDAFFKLIETLRENIRIDLKNEIIADWHDESHLNKYLADKNPLALTPSYLYPEDYDLPFKPKAMILDKMKYGGHSFLRGI